MTPMESAYCVQSSFIWGTIWIVPKRDSSKPIKSSGKDAGEARGHPDTRCQRRAGDQPVALWRPRQSCYGVSGDTLQLAPAGFVFDTASGNFAGVRLWESCGSISGCDIRRGGYLIHHGNKQNIRQGPLHKYARQSRQVTYQYTAWRIPWKHFSSKA